ncbi:MAG: hypothetical protein KIS66_14035 [Fimbriimonadaceae bacterium]|nr:hypothetical protein [Fimbriimonadaceae bacterium]
MCETFRLDWMPEPHRSFLERALIELRQDARIVGIAAAGSFIGRRMDEHSDLDLVLVVEDAELTRDRAGRTAIADLLGTTATSFTAEHVGEPRLLICLFVSPLLHVDLKFVTREGFETRVDDPVVLFERDGSLSAAIERSPGRYPAVDPQWIEDRFWAWIHYTAAKIRRGELLEAWSAIDYFLENVLAPLALRAAGQRSPGLRRIEFASLPEFGLLADLCVPYDRAAIHRAVTRVSDLYDSLCAKETAPVERRHAARDAALAYLSESL